MTNNKVKTVKANKVLINRIVETANLMKKHNNNIHEVAKEMNISSETVKRYMRKYKRGK